MIQSLIFFPEKSFDDTPERHRLAYEEVSIQVGPGVELFGWYFPAKNEKGVVIFFHGNAGNIAARLFKAEGWIKRGFSVLMVDYRSFGKSTGQIQTGEDIIEDSKRMLEWLIRNKKTPLEKIIFYGESLGSHPAIQLGSAYSAMGVILESPYTAFIDLAPIHYPWIPKFMTELLLKNFAFDNLSLIPRLKSPLFILHGTEDETCPYLMSGKLMAAAPEPKKLFSIPGGMHNDLREKSGNAYWEEAIAFLQNQ